MNRVENSTGLDLSCKSGVKTSFWDYSGLLLSNFTLVPLRAVAAAMTARILGTEGYGTIALYASMVSLAHLFTANWTVASVMRFGREEYDKRGGICQTFWARNLILIPCLLIGFLGITLFKHWISQYIGMPNWAIGLLMASVSVSVTYNYLEYILQAIHKMRAYAALQVIGNILSIAGLSLLFFKVIYGDYLTVITVGILSMMATTLVGFSWVPKHLLFPFQLDRKTLRDIFLFSYPIILGSMASYVVAWVDIFFINHYFMKNVVGAYQLSYQIFTLVLGMVMTVTVVTAPILTSFIANGQQELINRYASRLVPKGVLLWSVVIGVGLTISKPLFQFIFGEPFILSSVYFQYLVIGAAFNSLVCFHSGILTAYKLTKYMVVVSVSTAVLNLFGDMLLIPRIGPAGAALSTVGAIGIHAIFYLLMSQKLLKEKLLWHVVLVLPALLSLAITHLQVGAFTPLLAILMTLLSGFILGKRFCLFRSDDLILLDYIQMPFLLKRAVVWIYPYLTGETNLKKE